MHTKMPRRSSWHMPRSASPSFSRRPTTRESALWLRCSASPSSCMRRCSANASPARRSSTSYSLTPRSCGLSARSSAPWTRAWAASSPRHSSTRAVSVGMAASIADRCNICNDMICKCNLCSCMYYRRMTSPSLSPPTRWDASIWGLLAVLCGVLFLDGLDVSMVAMALPSIESDLGLTTSQLQWVVSGYVLGYGGFLLLGGRSADLLGRRRMLLAGLAVFTVASAIGGVVDDGTLLVATRFLKGAAAAFTAPAGLSIITTRFAEGPERNRALSIYPATGASGFSMGLVAGGLLTELGWRWVFLLPVPIALGLLVAAPRYLPRDRIA